MIDAILYLNRTGCQWRMLPQDFPNWNTVYGLYWQWRIDGTWKEIHDRLREKVRESEGKEKTPSAAVNGSQSAKTTEVGGEQRGYAGGKKVAGRKRHLAVDTLGLIIAVVVHEADVQDYDGARLVLTKLRRGFRRFLVVFGDSAYGKCGLPDWVKATFGWILQPILRSVEAKGFVNLPKRWIVERTFAWLGDGSHPKTPNSKTRTYGNGPGKVASRCHGVSHNRRDIEDFASGTGGFLQQDTAFQFQHATATAASSSMFSLWRLEIPLGCFGAV